eukprot:4097819-Alexandrium_andersonii.AAC.1
MSCNSQRTRGGGGFRLPRPPALHRPNMFGQLRTLVDRFRASPETARRGPEGARRRPKVPE